MWTRCHDCPGLAQVDAQVNAFSSHQHKSTVFNNNTSGEGHLDNVPMMTGLTG
jgi:hypothetical protein